MCIYKYMYIDICMYVYMYKCMYIYIYLNKCGGRVYLGIKCSMLW